MIVTLYKKTISRLLIFTACLLLGQLAIAQQYPVQIVPQLLPPYTLNVSDYYNGTNEKLVLLLTNTDLNKPTLQVRLRMSIQGQAAKLISRDNVYYPAITLDGGVPTRITLGDLAPYFNADNLIFEGITRAQYVQSGKLPEGFYQFCFEAVEVNSGQLVGRSSCAMAWISLSDPPLLNLPRKTESIVYKDPQNIIFQWTPRNYNSPTSAFNTEYEFTLVEIWDNGLAPEAAFGTAQPLYRTTTQATTLLYGPGEPLLLSGHKYAWRVRAQQTNGASGSDAWRNNGYSEIYWFNCQSDCAAPLNVQHELSGGRATITWSSNPNQTSFTVDYREKGQNGSTWYNSATTANRMMLYDLKKDKTYEYRVGGTCDNGLTYTYSDIKTLVMAGTDSAVNTDCGMLVAEENIKNRTPIQTLLTGDVITAGDFPVKLLQVSGQGAFTGAGYVTVPFIGQSRVKVRFTGITVNTDKQLIGGIIETTYDPKESQIGNLDEVIDGGGGVGIVVDGVDTAGYYVDMVIPDARSIDVELNKKVDSAGNSVPAGGATLTITGSDGTTKQVKVDELPATIKDKNGTIYGVDKDGNVSKVASSEPMNMTAAQLNTLQTDKAVVKFLPHEKQLYAFDEYQPVYSRSVLFNEEYEKLNNGYYVSSKAIVEAKADVVKAVVEIKDKSIIVDSIRFVTGKGTRYESTLLADSVSWEIKIVGGPAADAQELYALYPQGGGKFLPLGKLLIAAYPERTFKVVLVPVNGAAVNKDAISSQLDKIYKPVGITFQVTQDKSFDDKSWDLHKDEKLAVSGSGWLSTLTDEMKALNSAYSSARTVQQDAVYLFVMSGSDSTIAGDMPRGKQFGYLFNGADGKVAAHEIGHGLFSLKHVFDNNYGFKQGELPANVMDYPAGDRFAKHQWDLMYKPGLVIGLFEGDGDAQSQRYSTLPDKFRNEDRTFTFITPAGSLVTVPADAHDFIFNYGVIDLAINKDHVSGYLQAFTLSNIKYQVSVSSDKFYNYKTQTGGVYENISPLKGGAAVNPATFIIGVPCNDGFYICKFEAGSLKSHDSKSSESIKSERDLFETMGIQLSRTHRLLENEKKEYSKYTPDCQWCIAADVQNDLYPSDPILSINLIKAKRAAINRAYPMLGSEFEQTLIAAFPIANQAQRDVIGLDLKLLEKKDGEDQGVFECRRELYFLDLMIQYVQRNVTLYKQGLEQLSENSTVDDVKQVLRVYTDADYAKLQASSRLLLLRLLTKERDDEGKVELTDLVTPGNVSTLGSGAYVSSEVLAINILQFAPAEQWSYLLDQLVLQRDFYKTEPHLLAALTRGIDGGNFARLTEIIGVYLLQTRPIDLKKLVASLKDGNLIKFDGSFWNLDGNYKEFNSSGLIHFDVKKWYVFKSKSDVTIHPYDYVWVTFLEDFKLTADTKYEKDKSYLLPAYFIYFVFNESSNRRIVKGIQFGIDISTFKVGWNILSGLKGWTRVFAFADWAAGTSYMVFNYPLENTLERKFPGFIDTYNQIVLGYAVFRIGFAGVREAILKLKFQESTILNSLSEAERAEARKLFEQLDEVIKANKAELSEAELNKYIDDNIQYFLNSTSKRPLLTNWVINEAGASKAAIYDQLANYNARTLDALEAAVGKYAGLKGEFLASNTLLDYFNKLKNTFAYKYRLKWNQLKNNVQLPENFLNVLDEMPASVGKTMKDGPSTQKLGDLFEDELTDIILGGRYNEIPGLHDKLVEISNGYTRFMFEAQVQVKLPGHMPKPDIVAFNENLLTRLPIKDKGYWFEIKIDEGSGWREPQKELRDNYIGNGSSLEVRSSKLTNIQQGQFIELKKVVQISVGEDGILLINIK